MNRDDKNWAQFQEIKYQKKSKILKEFFNKSWSPSQIFFIDNLFLEKFDQFLTQKNYYESTNLEMFEEVVHNFGKSDDTMIKCLFLPDEYMISCPT